MNISNHAEHTIHADGQFSDAQSSRTELTQASATRDLRALRKQLRQSQTEFWARFGVTQSRGSRYEKGLCLPHSVAILIALYLDNKVNDTDLLAALHRSNQQSQKPLRIN